MMNKLMHMNIQVYSRTLVVSKHTFRSTFKSCSYFDKFESLCRSFSTANLIVEKVHLFEHPTQVLQPF
jgi:hypothetical protein